jgi:rhodanese-related sulfurtransferase
MMGVLDKMKLEQKLALVALVLGVGALFGDPIGGGSVRINTEELAVIVETEVDHVSVHELADWIIQQKTDYRLIDVRDPTSYADYHIPTAENVGITGLAEYSLARTEKVVLYSNGGLHSAQAWFLLKAKNYPGVYMLFGGLEAWKDEILFPEISAEATSEEIAGFEQARFVSSFFGGSPRTDGAMAATAQVIMPKVEVPAATPVGPRKKRTKEGC